MTPTGEALRLALHDLYRNSWRLVPLNAAVGLLVVAAAASFASARGGVVLVVLTGPLVAALVHCAVTLVRTGNLAFADALEGLRLHWRRGLALGAAGAATVLLGAGAARVYMRSQLLWPLAFLTIYLLLLLVLVQLVLWTLAIAEPGRALRECGRDAVALVARRPGSALLLGLVLLCVNVAGIAAAVMPFLTVTIAYSLVAAAHFALPRPENAS
jgi:hypothetical protein